MFIAFLLSILVAVIDTGASIDHPHFSNTKIDTYNALDGSNEVIDNCRHGTGVAGLVVETAPKTDLLIVKVSDDRVCRSSYKTLARAVVYAADNGADIICITFSGYTANSDLENAVNYALSKGIVIVASTGSDEIDILTYPSNFEGVIKVSCNMEIPCKAYVAWSGWRDSYDYVWGYGSSYAAPVVAGNIALEKQSFIRVILRLLWLQKSFKYILPYIIK